MDSIVVTDISSIVILQNLGALLLNNLNSPTYQLTQDQQSIIQHFVQTYPSVFEKLTADIRAITNDDKIDLHDIPHIIQLFTDTYSLYSTNIPLLSGDNLIVFIQYTLNVIIDSKFVVLPDVDKKIIEAVIYASIQLLRTNIIPVIKSWFSNYRCW
jgi:hypothetical protein